MKAISTFVFLVGVLSTQSVFAAPTSDMGSQTNAPIATESGIAPRGSYFDWGQGQDGFGYCYEWTRDGRVLNGGMPVADYNCEARRPAHYTWHRSVSGWGNCYRFTPSGLVMDRGQPKAYYNCERYSPSYFNWARATNGYTYCFQFGNGLVLNEGRSVPNYNCQ
ncbi:MAG: hypothetical protein AABZ31_00305 [Bdellovibrionota bacterium]